MSGPCHGNNTHRIILDRTAPIDQIMDDVNLAIYNHGLMFCCVAGGPDYESIEFELVKVKQ